MYLNRFFRTFSVPIFGRLFDLDFRPLFGPRSVCDLLVLRDFFDFEGCSGPVFGPLLDRTFAPVFNHFGTRLFSLPRFTPSVDTLPIRTLNCTPASI